MKRRALLGLPFAASGCSLFRQHPAPAPVAVHYVVGPPYRIGGVWRYPQARFDYDETGLAEAFAADQAAVCTDGAPYDPAALIAAHRTLQLPSVVRVTNLETGRQVAVRVEQRGPASPARLLALSPRAMTLLGPGSTPGVLRVRVQVQEAESRALADALPGEKAPLLPIAAAPTGAVRSEQLAPPPGIAQQAGGQGIGPQPAPAPVAGPRITVPLRLPETVTQVVPRPGQLYVQLAAFGQPRYAEQMAARLAGIGAIASASYTGPRDRAFRVRIGPLAAVAEADRALDQALRAGVVDARIIVDQG